MRIGIVGAGIGGLTTALALTRQGADCVVLEQRPEPAEDGTGIQISPNAAAALLGLGVRLDFAVPVASRELRRWADGTVLGRTDLSRYRVPYLTMRRGQLTEALREAPVHFGRRCVTVCDDGAGVVLGFTDGTEDRFDAVIGADGLHSAVRAAVGPADPRYSGLVASRAVLPSAGPHRVTVWLGPGRHCVTYPIAPGLLNLVVVTPADQPPDRPVRVTGDRLLPYFDGWHPAVRELIDAAGELEQRALYDLPPVSPWCRGRVMLIGDAAHPILPFIAQGAAQAIEDAVTLARCTDLSGFEALRRDRVRQVYEMSRAGLRVHHLPDGAEQRIRDAALATADPGAHDWLYRPRSYAAGS
ncbi:FAD-dependent oxidoreductase [Actinoplanes derwentensis]|uniref:Salicylate hydroxylase n=1 Tax=Actinoplanes derwentensis TaxID=113562 RepID=A0A1H2C8A1_9ACTN|nr:FAD-dependent oxidoreductase [Actinoplanes derwentensis]GID86525.1 monooxygenase [Actinoplanes derwentensis]SDT66673.1 salicylate hydroxylase [Actinoplanes derwentensis]